MTKHISAIDGTVEEKAPDDPRDVGDIKSVKATEKEAKTDEQVTAEFLREMMLDVRGRRWFFKLIRNCRILQNPFSDNPLTTAFACGEMNIGQQVFLQLQASCPDLYLKMMEENNG